jgi:hypothetical protein
VSAPIRRPSPARGALVASLFVAGALAACGNKNAGPYPMYNPSTDAAATGTAGIGGGLIGGGFAGFIGGFGGAVDAGVPSGTVEIAIESPADGTILSVNAPADVSAKVTIKDGTDLVDPSTVRVSLVGLGGSSAAPLVGPSGDNLFTGKLSLAGLASGDYTLTVTARSSTNLQGSKSVSVKIDGGPTITVLSPIPGHHYKGSIIVQAIIDPGMYAPASAIGGSIAASPITLQPAGPANEYRAVFDLGMPVALTGDQVFEISAKDARGTATDIKFVFNVDVTGPDITMSLPAPGSIVGQVIRLAANISDGAGLDTSTLQVLIGDQANPQFKLPLTLDQTGAFSALFDTKLLTQCKLPPSQSLCIVRPTVSFRAADALGNETALSYEIAVDNLPPIADLVPPEIRVSKLANGLRCSFAFDPLSNNLISGDAPDDGCLVPQLFDLRARIQDTGNHATGLKQDPISGVDPAVTAAYVLADTSQPLVVDNDGDGNCDVINPKLVPTTMPLTGAPRQVLKIRMRPVPPAGAGDFTPDPSLPGGLACLPGMDLNPPANICHVEQPTVAISYAGGLPAIWAVEPIAPDDPRYCFGSQLDTLANNVPQGGWRCVAVATADLNGNLSTSMPIRVWVDYGDKMGWCAAPPANAGPMPNCTGTYDKATDTVSPTACTARTFAPPAAAPIEVCFNNDC